MADEPSETDRVAAFTAQVHNYWDLARLDKEVRESQARRHITYEALRQGHYHAWDHEPESKASRRFMRNDMDLNVVESQARYP